MAKPLIAIALFLAGGFLAGVHAESPAVTFAVWLMGGGIVLYIDERIAALGKVIAEYAKLKNG